MKNIIKIVEQTGKTVLLRAKLGLYKVRGHNGETLPGLAIRLIDAETEEPYATLTVSPGTVIETKDAAHVDTHLCTFAPQLIEQGIATSLGHAIPHGFWCYPLYKFDAAWLEAIGGDVYREYSRQFDEYMAAQAHERGDSIG